MELGQSMAVVEQTQRMHVGHGSSKERARMMGGAERRVCANGWPPCCWPERLMVLCSTLTAVDRTAAWEQTELDEAAWAWSDPRRLLPWHHPLRRSAH